jgi:sarcosine oxidase subunit alpha
VVLAACDSGYGAARDLEQAGIEIALIADLREQPGTIAAREGAAGIQIWQGVVPRGTDGGRRVKAVELVRPGRLRERANVPCDLVAMAGGWTPDTSLFAQAGGWLEYDAGLGAFVPAGALEHVRCAGACRGTLDLAAVLSEGAEAGHSAAMAALGRKTVASTAAPCPIEVSGAASLSGGLSGEVGHGRRPELVKSFVDFQNDITAADLRLAVQEGFRELEQVGVYTGGGSGTDGGRTAALHMSAIIAKATAKTLAELKPPAARWPVVPISIGALAGPSRGEPLDPRRAPPSHDWAVAHRAIVEDDGAWRRARAFPREGEDLRAAVVRECRLVRSKAGVLDLSALGKIEVSGPGAAPFLAYLLAGDSLKLAPGTCRYGLILCEDGTVLDHAIIACLGTGRYLITTTAGNDARVLDHLEGVRQRDRAQLDVHLTSVTEQWAAFAVQGPHARALLGPLVEGIDLSSRAMPHMSVREGRLLVAPLCLLRVSSTGEAGYEVFVPACFGGAAWEALAAEAEKVGGVPFGMEAMRVLRAEKGYCLLGNEIDGTVTPDDLGLGWMLANAKGDFIGKRSLSLPAMSRPGRRQLVGLRTESHAAILDIGSQITAHLAPPIGTHSLGHVTSAYWSETLGRSIALALVENGRARLGERLFATTADGTIPVTITSQVFYDPDARRIGG